MKLLLGDKNDFAVEVDVTSQDEAGNLMGYARIWFGGTFLGSFFDFIYMDGYLLGGLFRILNSRELNNEGILSRSAEEQYRYLEMRNANYEDNEISYYRISFGTMADAFSIWAFREQDDVSIVWKIMEDYINYDDLKDYPRKAFKYTLNFDHFSSLVKRLERIFDVWQFP